jgi:hypothetical protein
VSFSFCEFDIQSCACVIPCRPGDLKARVRGDNRSERGNLARDSGKACHNRQSTDRNDIIKVCRAFRSREDIGLLKLNLEVWRARGNDREIIEAKERAEIQKKIQGLNEQRRKYVAAEMKKQQDAGDKTLGSAVIQAVREQAKTRDFEFEQPKESKNDAKK